MRRRVGKQVQRLRMSRGLSQERLAESVGNTGKHIGQIERGEVNVGIDILAGIARVLAVDMRDLFAAPVHRRRLESHFLINRNQLKQLEDVVRSIRTARIRASNDRDD